MARVLMALPQELNQLGHESLLEGVSQCGNSGNGSMVVLNRRLIRPVAVVRAGVQRSVP